jgi:Flp pilus assembly protein TadD
MNNLARDLMSQERYQEALVYLDRCVKSGSYSYCFINRGVVLGALGRDEEAEAALQTGVVLDLGRRDGRFNLAMFLIARGYLQKPFVLLSEADEYTQGRDLTVRIEMIAVKKKMGEHAEAVKLFQDTRAVFGSNPKLMAYGYTAGLIQ